MMNSQRSDAEKINLIEEGTKIGINEVIKQNEIINNSLKPETGIYENEIILFKVQKRYRKYKPKSLKNK